MGTGGMDKQPGTGGLGSLDPGIEPQDLSRDPLISNAPFSTVNGKPVPMLGGIPLLRKLGQGGMGAVYYGIHPRLESEVAVKVLPFHLAEQFPEVIDRFFREAKIAARVKSPHLIAVTDVNQEAGLFYLVMEYITGKSAGAHLKAVKESGEKWLDEDEALDICIAATTGLAAAHEHGIIHRDIKPDNIMIPKTPGRDLLSFSAAKLADLGLARTEELGHSLTGSNACLGTPGYMPPEQAEDAKSVRKPGDVFSMGATLYALLSGQAPFTGSALMKVLRATQNDPHRPIREINPTVSASTAALLDRCLAKDPTQRYADAQALLDALKQCRAALSAAPISHSPSVPPPLVVPQPSRLHAAGGKPAVRTAAAPNRKPLLIAGGVVAIALLAFAAGQLVSGKRAPDTNVAPVANIEPVAAPKATESRPSVVVAPSPPNTAVLKPPAPLAVVQPVSKNLIPALPPVTPSVPPPADVAEYAKRINLPATLTLDLGGGVKMELVLIPAGKFMMGSPEGESGRYADEGPQHEVTITKPFYMAKYETTQEQYEAIIGSNPSQFKGPKNPVDQVSWDDAQAFCQKLNAKCGKTARLPTEAEWEYACRAGTTTRFYSGDDDQTLDTVAWYSGNAESKTHPVGQKTADRWGLYDMHGNVWEWCQDWKGEYAAGAVTDPTGPTTGAARVLRGGSWRGNSQSCRSAYRLSYYPASRNYSRDPDYRRCLIGFRVVVLVPRTP